MRLILSQSRPRALPAPSLSALLFYSLLISSNLVVGSELPVRQVIRVDQSLVRDEEIHVSYEPDFSLFDRSILGRAPAGVAALGNNGPEALNLDPGSTACYMVEKKAIFDGEVAARGKVSEAAGGVWTRQDSGEGSSEESSDDQPTRTLYISANTCLQPRRVSPDATTMDPPQLSLFVTNVSDIGCPDPSKDLSQVQWEVFDEGAIMLSVNATGDIYIGISAPNISTDFQGIYNFEVAVSTDNYYHSYDGQSTSELLWMDSDSTSALLVTKNLTQDYNKVDDIMGEGLPYELYVENNSSRTLNGLRHSVCGLENMAQISANQQGNGKLNGLVRTMMTTRGPGRLPKQQFYFVGLNSSSSYSGILVKTANGTSKSKRQEGVAGGGGTVFQATQFQTLSGTNCKVVTDLEFCDEIQYAVPGNDEKFNNTALGKVYDDYAKEMYANFEKVMMQIPCENPPESLYSLARNCTQCKEAYKRWLCTVSFPRCEDFMSNSSRGIIRNVAQAFPNGTRLPNEQKSVLEQKPYFNTSRNKFIDEKIQPGPYKEVLPCEDVCYQVVQSCPAAIGFRCPLPFMPSFNVSYGQREPGSSEVTCNFPGEARTRTSAASVPSSARLAMGLAPLLIVMSSWACL